eukprot:gene12489-16650_t
MHPSAAQQREIQPTIRTTVVTKAKKYLWKLPDSLLKSFGADMHGLDAVYLQVLLEIIGAIRRRREIADQQIKDGKCGMPIHFVSIPDIDLQILFDNNPDLITQ